MAHLYDITVRKQEILMDPERSAEVWAGVVKDPNALRVLRSLYWNSLLGERTKPHDLNTLVYAAQKVAEAMAAKEIDAA